MKRILFSLMVLLAVSVSAQEKTPKYKLEGSNITQVKSVKSEFTDSLTTYTFTTTKGEVVPVYKSVNNKFYISRVSKKGNYYRKYLDFKLD